MPESDLSQLRVGRYTIARELLEKGYRGGRGPCTCTSVCCQHGVYADVQERDIIFAHKDVIAKHMDETQTRDESAWFEKEEYQDNDFPSGQCVSTEVVNEKCAFLDKLGRCSLQVAATHEGMHKWAWKPLFCILFPLEISNNVIGFDDLLDDDQPCCTISGDFDTPIFAACQEELTHVLGESGYATVQAFYQKQTRPTPVNPTQRETV